MGKSFPYETWNRRVRSAVLLTIMSAAVTGANAAVPAAKFTVVLDPGHGGTDLGAVHRNRKGKIDFTEKDATLRLAKEARRQLEQKGYRVLLTRDRDAYIAHTARTAIANRAKAAIFVSLHMNSVAETAGMSQKALETAEGVETFLLNTTTDLSSKRLADLENKGLDPTQGSPLKVGEDETEVNLILKDMTLDANLPESKRLACALQDHLTKVTGQKTRGVKQALFVVLLGADMPSVLVEAGFVTSPRDRKLISSSHGSRAMGAAIVRAVEQFRLQHGTAKARQALSSCLVSGQ